MGSCSMFTKSQGAEVLWGQIAHTLAPLLPLSAQAAAIELVKNAILAGVFNDLGSGSNVDITVIRKGGEVTVMRGYVTPNDVGPLRAQYQRPRALTVPAGATAVLSTHFEPAGIKVEEVQPMVL